ncbi:MAG: hypothetical protein KDD89_11730 [Anaerolineales bacterium]|nr:hypothetical protein [Anaerolineales bacterium]
MELLNTAVWLAYLQARQAIAHDYSQEEATAVLTLAADFYADANHLYDTLQQRLATRSGSAA